MDESMAVGTRKEALEEVRELEVRITHRGREGSEAEVGAEGRKWWVVRECALDVAVSE